MKFEVAYDEASKIQQQCLNLLRDQNAKWKISDEDLGALKGDEFEKGVENTFASMVTFSYLGWLVKGGLVEDLVTGDASELTG